MPTLFRKKLPLIDRLKAVALNIDQWAQLPHDPARAAHLLGGDSDVLEAIEEIERLQSALNKSVADAVDAKLLNTALLRERGAEPVEMRVCEQSHLVLKPGVLYLFTVDPGCEECKRIAAEYAQPFEAQPSIPQETP